MVCIGQKVSSVRRLSQERTTAWEDRDSTGETSVPIPKSKQPPPTRVAVHSSVVRRTSQCHTFVSVVRYARSGLLVGNLQACHPATCKMSGVLIVRYWCLKFSVVRTALYLLRELIRDKQHTNNELVWEVPAASSRASTTQTHKFARAEFVSVPPPRGLPYGCS